MNKSQLECYFNSYNINKKNIIFIFEIGIGGIGDYLKFLVLSIHLCSKKNISLYVYSTSPISEYIKLKPDILINHTKFVKYNTTKIVECDQIENLENCDSDYFLLYPDILYKIADNTIFEICKLYNFNDLFEFNNIIIDQSQEYSLILPYIAFHLRLGDKYLETDSEYILIKYDTRSYDEMKIFQLIENNKHLNILFVSDNKQYKDNLKNKFPFINITPFKIGHTSLKNTSNEDFINAVVEFYLLTKAEHIYACSYSGYSIVASFFGHIPITIVN